MSIKEKQEWLIEVQKYGLVQAVTEFVAMYGDTNQKQLCDVFGISMREAWDVIDSIIIEH